MESHSDTTQVFRGRVKWFNSGRGYGFITNLDKEEDVFVHHSGITTTKECWKTLTPGEYVEYGLETDSEGKSQASNVTGIAGGPLLCETNNNRHNSESGERRTHRNHRKNSSHKEDDSNTQTETQSTSS